VKNSNLVLLALAGLYLLRKKKQTPPEDEAPVVVSETDFLVLPTGAGAVSQPRLMKITPPGKTTFVPTKSQNPIPGMTSARHPGAPGMSFSPQTTGGMTRQKIRM
jgi:hypothetical protein